MMSKPEVPHRRIGTTNLRLPAVGIGCSDFGNRNRERPTSETTETISAALENGFNYFDTAPYYGFGLSERRVGDALRGLPTDSYILSTKVGRRLTPSSVSNTSVPRNGFYSAMPFVSEFDYSYDGIMRSWEASLHRLGLARANVLLVHDIGTFAHGDQHSHIWRTFLAGGLRALSELKAAGEIDAFGLGVNETAVCEQMLKEGDVDLFLLAGRYTLLDHKGALPLLDQCVRRKVSVIAAAPYNSGLLAGGTKREGRLRYDYGNASPEVVSHVKAIEKECDRFGIPIGAAALQFALSHVAIAAVLPGIAGSDRVITTKAFLDQHIPGEFWARLREKKLVSDIVPLGAWSPRRSDH